MKILHCLFPLFFFFLTLPFSVFSRGTPAEELVSLIEQKVDQNDMRYSDNLLSVFENLLIKKQSEGNEKHVQSLSFLLLETTKIIKKKKKSLENRSSKTIKDMISESNIENDERYYHGSYEISLYPVPSKKVALTFDDGPYISETKELLLTLYELDVKATFYLLGKRAVEHPELVVRITDEGHEIGNHSRNHYSLSDYSPSVVQQEITNTQKLLTDIAGEAPLTFRPPYGSYNSLVVASVETPIVLRSVDPRDRDRKTPEQVALHVISHTQDKGIILLHDKFHATRASLRTIVHELRLSGYEFVTVSELLNILPENVAAQSGIVYRSGY